MSEKKTNIKKGYKQTEIGVIPEDWEIGALKDATVSVASGKSKTENEIGDFPIYGSTGIIGYRKLPDYSGDKILIARVGANAGTINKVTGQYCVSDNTLVVSYQSKIDIDFSYYQLVHFDLNKLVFGSGQPLITGGQVKKILFTFPKSKPEQKAIAEVLADADALIGKLEMLIEKKKNLKQATMQQLLTGKKRFPGFSGEWEVKRLGDIAEFYKGKCLPKSAIISDGKYKCIHYGELFTIYPEEIREVLSRTDERENFLLSHANDVLMPTSDVTPNGLAKASCIKEDDVILGGDILIIRSFEGVLDGVFLAYTIRHNKDKIMQLVSGSTVYHLYGSDMKRYEISIPPTVKEQSAIATILSDMDAEIEALETERAKYQKIKQGMMQQLLTGKIRLM